MDFSLTDEQELGIKRGKEWLKNNIQRPFVIMGCAGCLDKDTRILTSEGYMTLEEIFKYTNSPMNEIGEHQVETSLKIFNGEEFTDMTKTHVTTKMKGYKIKLESGLEIISSYKHKFFKFISEEKRTEWEESQYLSIGDRITVMHNPLESCVMGLEKIVEIEEVFQRFYDITVPAGHCYIANGILSHNSGKSTLIKYLIEEMKLDDDEVYYCTFTGKAAQVLCQKGLNATTIHKLIYNPIVNEKTGEINFVLKESIPEYIKFIVLDEFYMINQKILDDLLSFGRKVIALGDNNQLPPPMNKPNNLDNNPDIVLTKPMRQSLDSPIIYLAYKAMRKENIEYGSYGDNVKVVTRNQLKEDYFLYDQIIAGKNATVQKLNNFYRKNILCTDSKIPIKGDKLMCLRNNWDISIIENKIQTPLINGMVGYLESDITEDSRIDYLRTSKIDFRPEFFKDTCFKNIYMDLCIFEDNLMKEPDYNDEKYMEIMKKRNIFKKSSLSRINYFNYGYVCTCYKAQGSEFNKVFFIQENLGNRIYWSHLYTGITRAKEKLILVL